MINYYRLKRASEIKKRLRRLLLKRGTRAILAIALALSWTLASWPALPFLPGIRVAQAGTLSLYVNTEVSTGAWTTVGTIPYLSTQDQPTNYIYAASNNVDSGVYGFADTAQTGTINSVYLYIYAYGVAETDFDTFVNSTNTGLGPPTSWGWVSVNVSSILTTWTAINNATCYFDRLVTKNNAGVDAAYLYVDYTLQPNTDQSAFRWRNDDGSESTATWKTTENNTITDVSLSEIFRVRLEIKETNAAATTVNAQLEFSSDATSCTTGAWTVLDTSSTAWRVTASANITNGDPTTPGPDGQLATTTGTFTAGRIFDTQNQDATGVALNNNHTEWEWAIRGDGAANSTIYRFRVTDAGTVLNTYTNCAQLTTVAAAGPTMEEVMRHGNWFSGGVEQRFFWAD